jgi:hypothetical protein
MRSLLSLVFVVLAVLTAGTRRAAAETGREPSEASTPVKSPGLALGLSIALPAAGYGLFLASVLPSRSDSSLQVAGLFLGAGLALIGPSGGHFYTGQVGRGLAFSGGRLLLLTLAAAAFAEGMKHEDMSESSYDGGAVRISMIELALCGAGILALSVWESIDTYHSAESVNRTPKRSLAVAPMLVRNGEGLSLTGLSLAGTY